MPIGHEHLPDDFNPDHLKPPSPESIEAMDSSLLNLRAIAESMEDDGFTLHFFRHGFNDGSKIAFNDTDGDFDSTDPAFSRLTPKRRVILETPNKVIFEYLSGTPDGRDVLIVTKPGLEVPRELAPTETVEATIEVDGLPEPTKVTFHGGTNHPLRQKLARFGEARTQGTDTLTEGKVAEFTRAINQATSSGVAPSGQVDLRDFAIW